MSNECGGGSEESRHAQYQAFVVNEGEVSSVPRHLTVSTFARVCDNVMSAPIFCLEDRRIRA